MVLKFRFGRELRLRLFKSCGRSGSSRCDNKSVWSSEGLVGCVWKIPLVNKTFHLSESVEEADFVYPTHEIEVNASPPRLIARLSSGQQQLCAWLDDWVMGALEPLDFPPSSAALYSCLFSLAKADVSEGQNESLPIFVVDKSELGSLVFKTGGRSKSRFNLDEVKKSKKRWLREVVLILSFLRNSLGRLVKYLTCGDEVLVQGDYALLRDLQYFAMWVLNFLSDLFDCR